MANGFLKSKRPGAWEDCSEPPKSKCSDCGQAHWYLDSDEWGRTQGRGTKCATYHASLFRGLGEETLTGTSMPSTTSGDENGCSLGADASKFWRTSLPTSHDGGRDRAPSKRCSPPSGCSNSWDGRNAQYGPGTGIWSVGSRRPETKRARPVQRSGEAWLPSNIWLLLQGRREGGRLSPSPSCHARTASGPTRPSQCGSKTSSPSSWEQSPGLANSVRKGDHGRGGGLHSWYGRGRYTDTTVTDPHGSGDGMGYTKAYNTSSSGQASGQAAPTRGCAGTPSGDTEQPGYTDSASRCGSSCSGGLENAGGSEDILQGPPKVELRVGGRFRGRNGTGACQGRCCSQGRRSACGRAGYGGSSRSLLFDLPGWRRVRRPIMERAASEPEQCHRGGTWWRSPSCRSSSPKRVPRQKTVGARSQGRSGGSRKYLSRGWRRGRQGRTTVRARKMEAIELCFVGGQGGRHRSHPSPLPPPA